MERRIVGRDGELAAIGGFIGEAGETPKALLIEGEPGIGKSALWRHAVDTAASGGWHVLTAAPSEAERRLSHATLTDLLGPVWDAVASSLPEPQRRALGSALLRDDVATEPDPRTTGTAIVTALTLLAADRPVLLAIDDAQWADEASGEVLRFAARRLPHRTAAAVAARPADDGAPLLALDEVPGGRLVRLRPRPLTLAAIHHVLADALGGPVKRPTLVEIARVAGGNPLIALELARTWVSGAPLVGDHESRRMPIPERFAALARRRVSALSEAAREVASLASLMARPTVGDLVAAANVDRAGEAIDEAVAAGILLVDGSRIRFSHPLLAAAIADALPPGLRRTLHRALAGVALSVEERGHHLAAYVDEPDAAAAEAIELAARLTASRGAPATAAELYRAAIRLTSPDEPETLARRELAAAAASAAAGDADSARSLVRSATARAGTIRTAVDAALIDADLAWADGRLHEAHDTLAAAVTVAANEPSLQGRVHARLAAFTLPLDVERARRYAELAAAVLDPEATPAVLGYVRINQFMASVLAGQPAPTGLLEEGLRLEREGGPDMAPSAVPLIWYNAVDDVARARPRHEEEDAWYRVRGDDGWRAERLAHRALTELRAGDWQLAERLADEACEVVEQYGRRGAWWTAFAWRSLVDAHRGRTERALSTLEPLVAAARERENRQWTGLMLSVLGFVRFAAGDLAGADAAVVEMQAAFDAIGHREPIGDRSETFHVETLVALGDLERARVSTSHLAVRQERIPRPWIAVTLPRAQALVRAAEGALDEAIERLQRPVDAPAEVLPFDRAWNQVVLGRMLRRARQKQRAADVLGEAAARFDVLGAPRWAAMARGELARVGLRRHGRDQLTESERRVAELAAAGMRNREVAAAAFMSEKTVEANLARVYQKLGIRSRAELGARLGQRGGAAET